MRRATPSTGIPIAPRAGIITLPGVVDGMQLAVIGKMPPAVLSALPDGFSFRRLDGLPAMVPPLDGDGMSDELRAAASPRAMRIEPEETWRARPRKAFWRGMVAGMAIILLPAAVGGFATAVLLDLATGGGR